MRLIDADALKEDLTRFYFGEVTAKNLIDEQPTVEPKRGKWTIVNPCHGYSDEFDCSVCGRRVYLSPLMKYCDYEYCPNCGAVMTEGGEMDEAD